MVFEIDSVSLQYNHNPILNGVYLKAIEGEITGLLGRNGSGKSCLLIVIFGSIHPQFHHIRFDDKNVKKKLYASQTARYLPQHHFVPVFLSLQRSFKMYGISWDNFKLCFPEFKHLSSQKIGLLSGGERRLIETYMILDSPQKILLFDEPFSHLAPLYIDKLVALFHQKKDKKIIIVSDHLFESIIQVSDSMYYLNQGSAVPIENRKTLEDLDYLIPR